VELNATFLLQLAIFLLLVAFLSPVLFRPFMRLFEERERRIVGAKDEAQALAGSADEKAEIIAQKTAEAQAEARRVLTTLRARAAEREHEILEAAKKAAATRIDDAREELFAQTEHTRASLKTDADKLAAAVVEKGLGRAA
jgi:F-type H+-transporting ATPase subunit b